MAKRETILGKGSDVFFTEEPQEPDRATAKKKAKEATVMTTVYLPKSVADKLDEVWLERKMHDKEARKSQVVTEALTVYFQTIAPSEQ